MPALDRARRRVAGGWRLLQPNALGAHREVARATSRSAPSGGRFLMRNSTGSILTWSASSSISTSVTKQPCGWPGARIARCWPGVDEDVLVRAAAVREHVDVRQREARAGAGAAGAPRLGVERGEHAVGRDAGLDLRERRRPVAGRQVLFLAIEHQLDRRVRPPSRAARRSGPACPGRTCCRSRRPCTR